MQPHGTLAAASASESACLKSCRSHEEWIAMESMWPFPKRKRLLFVSVLVFRALLFGVYVTGPQIVGNSHVRLYAWHLQ